MKQHGLIHLYQGIAYFDSLKDAEYVSDTVRAEFPAVRVVYFQRGWAVQVRISGDYIGRNGRPSMENACNAAFAR